MAVNPTRNPKIVTPWPDYTAPGHMMLVDKLQFQDGARAFVSRENKQHTHRRRHLRRFSSSGHLTDRSFHHKTHPY